MRFAIVVLCVFVPHACAEPPDLDILLKSSTTLGLYQGWSAPSNADPRLGVCFDLRHTAAKGLILLGSSEEKVRLRYRQDAARVARALMAAQQRSGFVPARATFLRRGVGVRAEFDPSPILPRDATTAATAFWLMYLQTDPPDRERVDQATKLALNWLCGQQLGVGGFLAPTTQANTGRHPIREIVLTTNDYRNTLLALHLANRTQPLRKLDVAADKATERLLALRLMNQAGAPATRPEPDDSDDRRKVRAALQLWADRYDADGAAPAGAAASLAASSQALQCLLIAAVCSSNPRWDQELGHIRAALQMLSADGLWTASAAALPATQPASRPSDSTFTPPAPAARSSTFGLPALLSWMDTARPLSRPALQKAVMTAESLEFRMAATICGLRTSLVEVAATEEGQLWERMWD